MEPVRLEIAPEVNLDYVRSDKFKTGTLSVQLITPINEKTASFGALLPSVLRRGTMSHPDMRSLSTALDLLYGSAIGCTVRKKGENQCIGFAASFIDEEFVPGGEKLLEPMCDLLGELLLDPVTRNGRFLNDYVESEKQNLIDAIRGIINDKRDYADLRLLQEMCRGERYGVDKFGSIACVEKITNQTFFRYYQELLSTAHLELFYCGSAERERVEEAISRAFAPLQRGRVVPPVIAEKKNAPETPREITERMDVTQGRLSMGWRASTNDAPAMMLANLIFGGYSNSKLFLNVREKLSLCYYASSAYHRSKGIVTVSSGIECRDVETAKREILAQLASVQRGEFEEWEVEGARACLIASLESRGDSAGRMEENALGQAATGIRETADELIAALLNGILPGLGSRTLELLEHLEQDLAADLLVDSVLLRVEVHEVLHVDHVVRENLVVLVADADDGVAHAAGRQGLRLCTGQDSARHGKDLARQRVSDRLGQLLTAQAGPDVHLLIELVAADTGDVVAARIEEQRVEIGRGVVDRGRLARAQTAVDLEEAVLAGLARVTLQRGDDAGILAEQLQNLRVGLHAESTDKAGDGELAVLIDTDVEHVLQVGLIFQPCAAVRDDRCGIDVLVGLIHGIAEVHAGAADDLGDDDALCTIDDERAAVGHEREIAHEDLLILDLAGLLVEQAHADLDRLRIGGVALFALFNGVLGLLIEGVVQEGQLEVAGVVADGGHIAEDLMQALPQEPVVGVLLDLQQVGHLQDLLILGIALANGLAIVHVLDLHLLDHAFLSSFRALSQQ